MRVLVVEDDGRLSAVLERALREEGHEPHVVPTGDDGLLEATLGEHDVVILDWMLPGMDGPSVCRELRARNITTPVLMLTARGSVQDRIEGLDALADDFLTKPFSIEELMARLRALGRRSAAALELPSVTVGDLVLDESRRTASRRGSPLELTTREFDVLLLLARQTGHVITRQRILDEVWDGESDLRSNVIDVYIANLRAKVDKPFGVESIETIRGVGYRLRSVGT